MNGTDLIKHVKNHLKGAALTSGYYCIMDDVHRIVQEAMPCAGPRNACIGNWFLTSGTRCNLVIDLPDVTIHDYAVKIGLSDRGGWVITSASTNFDEEWAIDFPNLVEDHESLEEILVLAKIYMDM